MPRYLMGSTRLSSLERMMMDPSRPASSRTESQRSKTRKKPNVRYSGGQAFYLERRE